MDVHTGKESALDLTLVSNTLAEKCLWEVGGDAGVGSDHYPVDTTVDIKAPQSGQVVRNFVVN